MAVGLSALRSEFVIRTKITDLSSVTSVRRIQYLLGTDWIRVRHDRPLDYLLTTRSAMQIPWAKSFEPESTNKRIFHGFDGDKIVPFMRGVRVCEFSRTSAGTLVDIPLKGNFALRIFEPLQGISLGENSLKWPNLVARRPSASLSTAVYIQLPKFHIVETGRSILAAIPLLHEVGVEQIGATLRPDDLLQSSSIDVAEGGVAVTSRTTAYHTHKVTVPKASLVIDKPFAFAIVDEQSQKLLVVGMFENASKAGLIIEG